MIILWVQEQRGVEHSYHEWTRETWRELSILYKMYLILSLSCKWWAHIGWITVVSMYLTNMALHYYITNYMLKYQTGDASQTYLPSASGSVQALYFKENHWAGPAPGPPQESLVHNETRISLLSKPSLTRMTLGQLCVTPRSANPESLVAQLALQYSALNHCATRESNHNRF